MVRSAARCRWFLAAGLVSHGSSVRRYRWFCIAAFWLEQYGSRVDPAASSNGGTERAIERPVVGDREIALRCCRNSFSRQRVVFGRGHPEHNVDVV